MTFLSRRHHQKGKKQASSSVGSEDESRGQGLADVVLVACHMELMYPTREPGCPLHMSMPRFCSENSDTSWSCPLQRARRPLMLLESVITGGGTNTSYWLDKFSGPRFVAQETRTAPSLGGFRSFFLACSTVSAFNNPKVPGDRHGTVALLLVRLLLPSPSIWLNPAAAANASPLRNGAPDSAACCGRAGCGLQPRKAGGSGSKGTAHHGCCPVSLAASASSAARRRPASAAACRRA